MPKKQVDWDTVSEVLKKKGIRIVALIIIKRNCMTEVYA